MIILGNETRSHKVQNETINGLNVMVLLQASANNTDCPLTDYGTGAGFDPSMVNLEVTLKRNLMSYPIISTNLGIVAAYNTILTNGTLWRKGITLTEKDANTPQLCSRNVFLYFGGHINVTDKDELLVTCTVNRGTYNAGVSENMSKIQIETNQSQGVETYIPRFQSYAIQGETNEDNVQIGDNLLRLALMSFEKDWKKPIFSSATLTSDRLDWTANEQELVLRHWQSFDFSPADNYFGSLASNVHPLYYPNTYMVHKGGLENELDRAKIKFTMQAVNVQPSKNFVCYTTYITSAEILDKAAKMKAKHWTKDAEKVPLTTGSSK